MHHSFINDSYLIPSGRNGYDLSVMHLPAVVHVSTGFLLCSLSLFSDVSHGSGDFALSGVRFVSNTRCLVLWLIHWAVNVLFTAFRMDHTDWLNGEMFDCNGCVCSVRSHLLRFLPHRLQMARMLLLTAWTGRDTGLSIWWFPSALGRGRSQVRHLERCTKPPEVKSTLIQLLARSMRQMKGFP